MTSHRQDLLGQYVRRITLDLVLVPCAFYLAWLIRFDGHPSFQELEILTWYLLPIALIYIIINGAFGIYRHLWAFASFRDIILLSEATSLGTLTLIVFNLALTGYRNCRFSVGGLIVGGLLTLILSTVFKYRRQLIAIFFAAWPRPAHTNPERVLIVGVNETAQQLATQIYLGRSKANYELVGFVDDDPYRNGMSVSGVEILGTTQQLSSLVRDKHIDVIVIARRPADQEQMWRLVSICRETTAQVKVLPDLTQVVDGCYEDPLALQDVSIDDILRSHASDRERRSQPADSGGQGCSGHSALLVQLAQSYAVGKSCASSRGYCWLWTTTKPGCMN